jgi:hypothetical protein
MNVNDFKERLRQADRTLRTMAEEAPLRHQRLHLQGKAEGVRLALSYLREYERPRPATPFNGTPDLTEEGAVGTAEDGSRHLIRRWVTGWERV